MKPITLLTERLILRRSGEKDSEDLFRNYLSDVTSSRFLTRKPHTDIGQTKKFLKEWCDIPWDNESKKFAWVISLTTSNEGVGVFLVEEESKEVQIHYGIGRDFTGKGLITEAGAAVIKWLLNEKKVQKIWALCDLANKGSKRVLEKLGFKNDGIHTERLVLPAFNNTPRDCYKYVYEIS